MPESSVEVTVSDAFGILLGQGDTELAKLFLSRAVELANRAIAEGKLQNEVCRSGLPDNRGRLMRAYSYAKCLLGLPLDGPVLSQASRDCYAWAMAA